MLRKGFCISSTSVIGWTCCLFSAFRSWRFSLPHHMRTRSLKRKIYFALFRTPIPLYVLQRQVPRSQDALTWRINGLNVCCRLNSHDTLQAGGFQLSTIALVGTRA